MFSLLFSLALGTPIPQQTALYEQCGGQEYKGATACAVGTCQFQNQYYSQCLEVKGENPTKPPPPADNIPKPEQKKETTQVKETLPASKSTGPTDPSTFAKPQSPFTPPSPGGNPIPPTLTFKATLTTRDDGCIADNSKCGPTQGGNIDPGALGKTTDFPFGQTQCQTNPLATNILGLDSVHFGTDSDGVITAMCGREVTLTNPANGKTVKAVVTDRIPSKNGGGVSQVDASIAITRALGAPDGVLNINEVEVSY